MFGVLRYGLALVLAAAAAGKLRGPAAFRQSLRGYGLRPPLDVVAASAVIAAEVATAVAAFTPVSHLVIGLAGAGLGLVFLVGQVYLLATGNTTPCLCFGERSARPISLHTALRAAAVLVAGLLLLLLA